MTWPIKRHLLRNIVKRILWSSTIRKHQEIVSVLKVKSSIKFSTFLSAFVDHWTTFVNCLDKTWQNGNSRRRSHLRMTGSLKEARTQMTTRSCKDLNFTTMHQWSSVESAKYSESLSKSTCSPLDLSKSLQLSSTKSLTTLNPCCQLERVVVCSITQRISSIW